MRSLNGFSWHGAGIPPNMVEQVFDPFSTTKPGFARQSGGQVRIYSEVGQGTMVCLYLPRHHAQKALGMSMPIEEVETAVRARRCW